MQIGIGLPNPIPGTPGRRLVDWAQRAEDRGFAGLATIDRIVYPSHDTLASLAAVAGATSRIGLMSNILVAPAYPAAVLAKQAATIAGVSEGRFTLGIGVGGRADDFEATGADFRNRGKRLDDDLELLHATWRGEAVDGFEHPIANRVDGGAVPVIVGGTSDAAVRRVVEWGAGWAMGGGTPDQAAEMIDKVRTAWRAAGRQGEPRFSALAYYSLGDEVEQMSRTYLNDYYAFIGDYAAMVADGALRSEEAIAGAVEAFAAAGVTELYFDPTSASLDQIDRLAAVVLR